MDEIARLERQFTQDDILAILGRFADKIAVALDTARVFQERMRTIEDFSA